MYVCIHSFANFSANNDLFFVPYILQTRASDSAKVHFSPSKVKEWAIDDLNRTISWLGNQEEKVSGS